ncbi:protein-tyrosine phosphatase [Pseudoclavibacter chungangensis]|nr:low molecular weight protein-tyrosine-phosphatase [Pseudoclavibacter chungangensis]NYJ68380.1 protein-tyrosine phosphatase [Pseudoclavibacter chungangensis]
MPARHDDAILRICFVCTGNICRSPMAEVIFRDMVDEAGLADAVYITSAGTGEWHVGEKADPRTRAALDRVGYSAENHRAKQFEVSWFETFDLIVTFDRGQRRILRAWARDDDERALIRPLLSFSPADPGSPSGEVPDPYYGSDELFDRVRDMIEVACRGLLAQIEPVVRAAQQGRRASAVRHDPPSQEPS